MKTTAETTALINSVAVVQSDGQPHPNPIETDLIILKRLGRTTWPLVIVGFIQAGEDFSRLTIMSRLSESALAADALQRTTFGFMVGTDTGFLTLLPPLIAQAFGRQNYEEIGQIVKQGWILGTILSVPTMVVLLCAEPLLNAFKQDHELTSLVGPYARVVSFACPAIYGIFVDMAFLKSTARITNLIPLSIVSSAIGVGLSYLLISGNLGVPVQGIMGAGYTTLTQAWVCWIGLKLYFLKDEFRLYRLFNFRSMDYKYLKQMLRYGSPITLLSLVEQGRYFLTGLMTGWLGTTQLAITQATTAYLQFFIPPTLGIRQASQILVAQSRGRRDYERMRRSGNIGIILEASVDIIPLIMFTVAPMQLAGNFISEESLEGFETTVRLTFLTSAVSKILESIQGPTTENLKGLLDTWFPSIIQLLCSLTLSLPLSYLMAFTFDWDLAGINAAACIGTATSIPPLLLRWRKLNRTLRETQEANGVLAIEEKPVASPLSSPSPSDAEKENEKEQDLAINSAHTNNDLAKINIIEPSGDNIEATNQTEDEIKDGPAFIALYDAVRSRRNTPSGKITFTDSAMKLN